MKPEREQEMAEAIARAEEEDEFEDSGRTHSRPRPPRKSAGDVYTFRLPKERRDQLREAAERHGVPPATLIRQWIELQLDQEAKQRAVASLIDDSDISTFSSGSFAHNTALRPIEDIDIGFLTGDASEEQLASLMLLGSLVPELTALGRDVHRRATSALNDLSGALDEIIGLIGSTKLLAFLEVEPRSVFRGAGRSMSTVGDTFLERLLHDQEDNRRHVLPSPNGGWDVKAPGAKRASSHAKTKAAAVRRAREIVHNAGGGEVIIHGRDGEVRTTSTIRPSEDPGPLCDEG